MTGGEGGDIVYSCSQIGPEGKFVVTEGLDELVLYPEGELHIAKNLKMWKMRKTESL